MTITGMMIFMLNPEDLQMVASLLLALVVAGFLYWLYVRSKFR